MLFEVDNGVLSKLKNNRGGGIHVIDPFKIPIEEAITKAKKLEELGVCFIILASTDYENFHTIMEAYISRLKENVSIPLILHFPPRKGSGYPYVSNADAALYPLLINSESRYFSWESILETQQLSYKNDKACRMPEFIPSIALTFGEDLRSYNVMNISPIEQKNERLEVFCKAIELFKVPTIYLYSRYSRVLPATVKYFRDYFGPELLIFASGSVKNKSMVEEYVKNGADFVIYAGALECEDWEVKLHNFFDFGGTI